MKPFSSALSPDQNIDFFDELPLWSAPFGLKILDSVIYRQGITALDIGFGTGFPLIELAMRLGDSSVVYGIDPWKMAIERARKKIEFYGITNIHIIEGLAEQIPLQDQTVDLVTSNNGLNNVSDLNRAIAECARVIRPGGQFLHTMNLNGSLSGFYTAFEEVLKEKNMPEEIGKLHQHVAEKRPAIDQVISKIEVNGFQIKEVIHDEFFYRFTNGTAMLNHHFIRLAFMPSWFSILPHDKAEDVFNSIEQKLNETAKIYSQLNLIIPFVLIDSERKSG